MSDLTNQPDWLHLKPYGYAPGSYQNRCMHCTNVVAELDKRAVSCRPCAAKVHAIGELRGEIDRLTAELSCQAMKERSRAIAVGSDMEQEVERLRGRVAVLEQDAARWLPVQDYEGYYEVSNFGQVRSLDRTDSDGNRRIGKMLHPSPTTKGYLRVSLWRENRSGERYVHRMVATAFHTNEHNKPEVNHKDGDTKNNHATNLEWVDQSENGRHRARVLKTGVLRPIVGVSTKDSAVIKFGSFQLAKDVGFTPSLIDKCIKGQRTHHKGFAWAYADAAIDAALKGEA
jgi:hypothetical protein